jgi:hypothetical protein
MGVEPASGGFRKQSRDILRIKDLLEGNVSGKHVHESRRLLTGLSDPRIERQGGRKVFEARCFDSEVEHRQGFVTKCLLVAGQGDIESAAISGETLGERVCQKLRAQECVGNAHSGKRIAVVGSVTDKGPAVAEAATIEIRQL